jgi:hypothetical protein
MFPWKVVLEVPTAKPNVQPDALLIRDDYEDWYVVEIELEEHSVARHIEPQLSKLAAASYGTHLLNSVLRVKPDLEVSALRHLLAHQPPGIVCVIDGASDSLRAACRSVNADLIVLAPYKSTLNRLALQEIQRAPAFRPRTETTFSLVIDEKPIGSSCLAVLPRGFPPSDVVTVMFDDKATELPIKNLGSERAILIPSEQLTDVGQLILEPIDPANRMYRVR